MSGETHLVMTSQIAMTSQIVTSHRKARPSSAGGPRPRETLAARGGGPAPRDGHVLMTSLPVRGQVMGMY